VASGNIDGYGDPENDMENYFYTIGENPYVPYIRRDGGYQGCLVLCMAPKTSVRFGDVKIGGSSGYWCLFALRYEAIFQLGYGEAGGVEIRFFVEYVPTGIIDLGILAFILCVTALLLPPRRREEG